MAVGAGTGLLPLVGARECGWRSSWAAAVGAWVSRSLLTLAAGEIGAGRDEVRAAFALASERTSLDPPFVRIVALGPWGGKECSCLAMGRPAPHLDSLSALGTLRPWDPETCVIDEDYFPGGTPEGEPRRHTEVLGLVSQLGSLARALRRALSTLEHHDGDCPHYIWFLRGEPRNRATFGTCLGPRRCRRPEEAGSRFPRLVLVPRTLVFGAQNLCAVFANALVPLARRWPNLHRTIVNLTFACELAIEFLQWLDPNKAHLVSRTLRHYITTYRRYLERFCLLIRKLGGALRHHQSWTRPVVWRPYGYCCDLCEGPYGLTRDVEPPLGPVDPLGIRAAGGRPDPAAAYHRVFAIARCLQKKVLARRRAAPAVCPPPPQSESA